MYWCEALHNKHEARRSRANVMPIIDEQEQHSSSGHFAYKKGAHLMVVGSNDQEFFGYSAASERLRADIYRILWFQGWFAQLFRDSCCYGACSSGHFTPSAAAGQAWSGKSSTSCKDEAKADKPRPSQAGWNGPFRGSWRARAGSGGQFLGFTEFRVFSYVFVVFSDLGSKALRP